jgi:hypothetical protein
VELVASVEEMLYAKFSRLNHSRTQVTWDSILEPAVPIRGHTVNGGWSTPPRQTVRRSLSTTPGAVATGGLIIQFIQSNAYPCDMFWQFSS